MGKKSVLRNPLGKVGDNILGKDTFLNKAVNSVVSPVGIVDQVQGGIRNIGEGLGEITGSNALRKQAMDQQQAAEEEAKRQANMSDAMARNAGGDATSIFLASGKRKKGVTGATGSAGSSNSRDTGVQS
jgi:hypothetical protein